MNGKRKCPLRWVVITMTLNMLMEFPQWNNRWPRYNQPKTLLSNCATMQKSQTSNLTVALVLDAPMTSSNPKTAQRRIKILMKRLQMHALLHCRGIFLYNVPALSLMIYFCRPGVELCMCALLLIDTQACS